MRKLTLILLFSVSLGVNAQVPVYKDKTQPINERVNDLLGRMTLEEKVAQLQNRQMDHNYEKTLKGLPFGTVHEMNFPAAECASIYADVQKYLKERTRLGIPAITCAEGIQGIIQNGCTIYPVSLAQSSTFNPQLINRMGAAIAEEARAIGIRQILSPVFDIARELRWGRVEETYGEDPFLIAEMGIAYVKGVQSKGDITCTPKHFIAHGTPSGGLNTAGVVGGPRELWSLYMYPFRRVINEAHPLSIMTCYSTYDGVPITGSRYYLTIVLRDSLGFDGYVYSDWGSVERLFIANYLASSYEDAARRALQAGVDVDVDDYCYHSLVQLAKEGKVSMEDIDKAVKRVLTVKFKLGLFDNLTGSADEVKRVVRSKEHVALAKQIADESIVLLKNENNILPLDLKKYRKIALIGPNANKAVMGDYAWTKPDDDEGVNLLQGLRKAVGSKADVSYAEGCDWWSQDTTRIAEAVELAKRSDVAIVAVGMRSAFLGRSPKNSTTGEGFDVSSLDLPGVQQRLLEAVKATGKPVIVVFISGKPLAMPWVKDNADAFVVQWFGGEQQGAAMADVLLGNVNPSGRLTVSFPQSTGNTPCFYNYYKNDRHTVYIKGGTLDKPARHYVFESPEPLWSFGEGLSYTSFDYRDWELSDTILTAADTLTVKVDVANTGNRDGKETVQLYVTDLISSVSVPIRQLKAFAKTEIKHGKTATVTLRVPISELAVYNEEMKRVVEPGDFDIQIGSSSNNIKFRKKVTVR